MGGKCLGMKFVSEFFFFCNYNSMGKLRGKVNKVYVLGAKNAGEIPQHSMGGKFWGMTFFSDFFIFLKL